MWGALPFGFRGTRDRCAGSAERKRSAGIRCRVEDLEGRSLLSIAAPSGIDQPPVLAPLATQSVEEGNTLAVQAAATDANPGHTVTYSLDPGAPAGATISPTTGLFVWTPPDVQSMYAITIRAIDSGAQGLSSAEAFNVMVFDVPPAVQAGVNQTITLGTAFDRSGSFTDPNPDTWTATVDYGDGSGVQPLALGADNTFTLEHNYNAAGTFTVSVTITDSQHGVGHGYFAVQVVPQGTPQATAVVPSDAGSSASAQTQTQLIAATGTVTAQPIVATGSTSATRDHARKAVAHPKVKHLHRHVPLHSTTREDKQA